MIKINYRSVMSNAWKIARKGAETFGGSPKQYISDALRQSWDTLKKFREYRQQHLLEVVECFGTFYLEVNAILRCFKGLSGTRYFIGDDEVSLSTFGKYSHLCNWSHMDVFGNIYILNDHTTPQSHRRRLYRAYVKLAKALGLSPRLIE